MPRPMIFLLHEYHNGRNNLVEAETAEQGKFLQLVETLNRNFEVLGLLA